MPSASGRSHGLEPKPEFPDAAYEDPALDWKLRGGLHDQYQAARVLWAHARLRRQAKPLLQKAAPLWTAWTTARDQLAAVFRQFWTTSDGHWRAQLLRLTDAERAAAAAPTPSTPSPRSSPRPSPIRPTWPGGTKRWTWRPSRRSSGSTCRTGRSATSTTTPTPLPQYRIVRGGTDYWNRATPLAASAAQLIASQREQLREVADLAGDSAPARRKRA